MEKIEIEAMFAFEFQSFDEWVNKAASWFQSTGIIDEHYICVDAGGRVCKKGKEFIRARDENTFPVRVYLTVPCVWRNPSESF
ncbi:hypothetical protein ADMFC3_12690 [Geovibrio sp. ADMFC3]